jgi:hypothetical protein
MGFIFKLDRDRFSHWQKENTTGQLLTYIHMESGSALQFSCRRYTGSETLDLPPDKLIALATAGIEKIRNPTERSSSSGDCEFGKFGTVLMKGEEPGYYQAWVLWNTKNEIIFVTYTALLHNAQEASQVHRIAMATSFG